MIFYTGIKRNSSDILQEQFDKAHDRNSKVTECLLEIKEIGMKIKNDLEKNEGNNFGRLMRDHWLIKKKMSKKISISWMDKCYENILNLGAHGGKILGAGGGGFIIIFAPENKAAIRNYMKDEGFIESPYNFDFLGTRIIINTF